MSKLLGDRNFFKLNSSSEGYNSQAKVSTEKALAGINVNTSIFDDSNSPNKYITGPFEVIKTDISKLKDSEIDFTKIYEDTAEPNESELTKEDNPNAVGISFEDGELINGEYWVTGETTNIENPEGNLTTNGNNATANSNEQYKNIMALLTQFLQSFMKEYKKEA